MGKVNDLIGKKFGKLTVLEYVGKSTWKCICDCGTVEYAKTAKLVGGRKLRCSLCIHVPSKIGVYTPIRPVDKVKNKFVWEFKCDVCGSLTHILPEDLRRRKDPNICRCHSHSTKPTDLTGKKFGRLTVLSQYRKDGVKYCRCECSCEKHTIKDIIATNLVRGATKSCGCLSSEKAHERRFVSVIGQEINGFKIKDEHIDIEAGYKHIVIGSCIYCGKEFRSELSNLKKAKIHLCGCKEYFINPLAGKQFGKWTVLADTYNEKHEHICLCKCSCDNATERYVNYASLTKGLSKSCGCDRINFSGSSVELEIKDFVSSIGNATSVKDRNILDGKEIDMLFTKYNIGIEFNGSPFHATLNGLYIDKPKDYHQQKFLLAKEKGIHLISIFDVDWWYKQDKIKMYLKSLFTFQQKIGARDCEVRLIEKELADDFFDKYHLQGKTHFGSINLGLFYNGEFYSVMSFGKLRLKQQKDGYYELHRYAVRDGYTIIGGANKLLNKFEREYCPKSILSYSDNDYFSGAIYERLGFENMGQSTPRYYWNKNKEELKREQCQLKYLKVQYPSLYQESIENSASNKEDYIMTSLGYCKVYRSGNTKWVKNYDTTI